MRPCSFIKKYISLQSCFNWLSTNPSLPKGGLKSPTWHKLDKDGLQEAIEESEQRRLLLVNRLKDAQDTLKVGQRSSEPREVGRAAERGPHSSEGDAPDYFWQQAKGCVVSAESCVNLFFHYLFCNLFTQYLKCFPNFKS